MSKRMRAMGQQPRADRLRAFGRLQKAPKSSKCFWPRALQGTHQMKPEARTLSHRVQASRSTQGGDVSYLA
ncbi:hypothetical protein WJX74_005790 [Apatococcus lobatus]|uniref:Uncharacterized protein n=2 Tax=Apatococcus TaxID=904362 RepID=A0AAW1T375_9CHLO